MTNVDYLSAINSSGSGLNITQIVDSLVEAEKTPQENAIQTKIDDKTTSVSAIGEVKSALSVLSSSLTNLVGKTSLAVSSNSTAVTASITDPSKAKTLNSAMTVSALAAGQTGRHSTCIGFARLPGEREASASDHCLSRWHRPRGSRRCQCGGSCLCAS